MHPKLINMDLQKGMVIKSIIYRLTHLKTFTWSCVNVFDKYLHWPVKNVKNMDV
jgi:hypothetical protein